MPIEIIDWYTGDREGYIRNDGYPVAETPELKAALGDILDNAGRVATLEPDDTDHLHAYTRRLLAPDEVGYLKVLHDALPTPFSLQSGIVPSLDDPVPLTQPETAEKADTRPIAKEMLEIADHYRVWVADPDEVPADHRVYHDLDGADGNEFYYEVPFTTTTTIDVGDIDADDDVATKALSKCENAPAIGRPDLVAIGVPEADLHVYDAALAKADAGDEWFGDRSLTSPDRLRQVASPVTLLGLYQRAVEADVSDRGVYAVLKRELAQRGVQAVERVAKARVYVDTPSEVPDGSEAVQGPQGGTYYETEGTSAGQARFGSVPDAATETDTETDDDRTIPDDELVSGDLDTDLEIASYEGTDADVAAVLDAYGAWHSKTGDDGTEYYTTVHDDEWHIIEVHDDYATAKLFKQWVYDKQNTWDDGLGDVLDGDIAEDFNADFWRTEDHVYHATSPASAASILVDGELQRRSQTRGTSNRSVGSAVFTSRTSPMGVYGDVTLEIDVEEMKQDGFTPFVEQEPPVRDARERELAAAELGVDDYWTEYDPDTSADTAIFYEDIPFDYVDLKASDDAKRAMADHVEQMAEDGRVDPDRGAEVIEWLENSITKAAVNLGKISKDRIYVDDPSEVPEGYTAEEGPQGGIYYKPYAHYGHEMTEGVTFAGVDLSQTNEQGVLAESQQEALRQSFVETHGEEVTDDFYHWMHEWKAHRGTDEGVRMAVAFARALDLDETNIKYYEDIDPDTVTDAHVALARDVHDAGKRWFEARFGTAAPVARGFKDGGYRMIDTLFADDDETITLSGNVVDNWSWTMDAPLDWGRDRSDDFGAIVRTQRGINEFLWTIDGIAGDHMTYTDDAVSFDGECEVEKRNVSIEGRGHLKVSTGDGAWDYDWMRFEASFYPFRPVAEQDPEAVKMMALELGDDPSFLRLMVSDETKPHIARMATEIQDTLHDMDDVDDRILDAIDGAVDYFEGWL